MNKIFKTQNQEFLFEVNTKFNKIRKGNDLIK